MGDQRNALDSLVKCSLLCDIFHDSPLDLPFVLRVLRLPLVRLVLRANGSANAVGSAKRSQRERERNEEGGRADAPEALLEESERDGGSDEAYEVESVSTKLYERY